MRSCVTSYDLLAVARNLKWALSASLQGSAHVVDLRNLDSVQTIRFDPPGSHQHNVSGLAFSPEVCSISFVIFLVSFRDPHTDVRHTGVCQVTSVYQLLPGSCPLTAYTLANARCFVHIVSCLNVD